MTRRFVILALVGLLLAGAGCAALWGWSVLWRPRSPEPAVVTINPGVSGRQVLADLQRRGLLPSALAGRLYLRLAGGNRSIHFGNYRFPAGSRPVDVLEMLLEGSVEMVAVTVVEGSEIAAVAAVMALAGIGRESEWFEISGRVAWVEDMAPEATSLEGFFFPDTYMFAVGTGVETAAHHLVDRFRRVWGEESARPHDVWGSPFEVVTLASLVEAETPVASERPRVAGVFLNRLGRGMLLQCDPTVEFALKRRGEWTGRLLRIHWGVDDAYNTYRFPGLPPGPINSPGRASIAAALAPEEHRFLYFVAAPGGGHVFSRTLAEHNLAVARWQQRVR